MLVVSTTARVTVVMIVMMWMVVVHFFVDHTVSGIPTDAHAIVNVLDEIASFRRASQTARSTGTFVLVAGGNDFPDALTAKGTRRHGHHFVSVVPVVTQGGDVGKPVVRMIQARIEGFHTV